MFESLVEFFTATSHGIFMQLNTPEEPQSSVFDVFSGVFGISIVNNLTEIIVFTLPYFNLSRMHPGFFFTQPIPCTSRLNVCDQRLATSD